MRIAGLLLLIAGCVVVVAGIRMNTIATLWELDIAELEDAIESEEWPNQIHNLHLAARQDHTITIGCFAALAGIILIGLAEIKVELIPEPFNLADYEAKRKEFDALVARQEARSMRTDLKGRPLRPRPTAPARPKTDPPEAPPNLDTREGKAP